MTAPAVPAPAGTPKRIALLGAESTGKSTLAHALAAHLQERGLEAIAVPETLREWCERAGRAPRPEEQLAIAEEHERRVDAAAARADFVVADTSALLVAIYAGMLYEDGALYRFAIERQRRYDATLVTGLDLPWRPDGLQREAGSREAVDALVREHLRRNGIGFQVVYGAGEQRLHGAVRALSTAGVLPPSLRAGEEAEGTGAAGWVWVCEKCSDPACEHRLFTKLKEARR
ncbi:MAG TPA: ATP-binding protein [Ramlibacter sp.]|uniref:ATP-binding protein n=1 Tax=Ramlibacter sp. TaxID=1917967 RepID=UPI002D7FFA41|nr:ATP-binding protein [Ramlibacter sp.]HET8745832.1 ATP-binding protein [Ramlibacter sp.]